LVKRDRYLSATASAVSLMEAQHSLEMPLVELWIGALSSGQVKLEQRGNFYQADSIWLVHQ
jgi:hypothetical protein